MEEIAPGLRRWTSWHDHWEEVGSLALDTEDGLVLIDPLEPPAVLPRPDALNRPDDARSRVPDDARREGVVHAALARRLLPNITIDPPQEGDAPPRFTEQPVQVPSRP